MQLYVNIWSKGTDKRKLIQKRLVVSEKSLGLSISQCKVGTELTYMYQGVLCTASIVQLPVYLEYVNAAGTPIRQEYLNHSSAVRFSHKLVKNPRINSQTIKIVRP